MKIAPFILAKLALLSFFSFFMSHNLQAQCSEQGTIFFADCDDGTEFFFIEKTDGAILDPYFANGVNFEYYDGQQVDYNISGTFASPCSIATEAVTVSCMSNKVQTRTICAGESVFLKTPVPFFIPNLPDICIGTSTITPFEDISSIQTDGFWVNPTSTSSYTLSRQLLQQPGNCGFQFSTPIEYLVVVEECSTPEPTIVELTICEGEEVFLAYPAGDNIPSECGTGLNSIMPFPGFDSFGDSGFAFTPTSTTTYTVTRGNFLFDCPISPIVIEYIVTVEDCSTPDQPVLVSGSIPGFDGMTVCAGQTVRLRECVSTVAPPGCPVPIASGSISISPAVSASNTSYSGSCVDYLVTPQVTTTYRTTVLQQCSSGPGIPEPGRSRFTINVVNCNPTPPPPPAPSPVELTVCRGNQILLAAETPATIPFTNPVQTCMVQSVLLSPISGSDSPAGLQGWWVAPTESTTYTVTSNYSNGPGFSGCASGFITYNVTVEECNPAPPPPIQTVDLTVCQGEFFTFSPGPTDPNCFPLPPTVTDAATGQIVSTTGSLLASSSNSYLVTTTFSSAPGSNCTQVEVIYNVTVENCNPPPPPPGSFNEQLAVCLGDVLTFPTISGNETCVPFLESVENFDTGEVFPTNVNVADLESGTYKVTTAFTSNCTTGYQLWDVTVEECAEPVEPVETPVDSECFDPTVIYELVDCDVYGYDPVCSCDNITYNNICEAYFKNGITTYEAGACVGEPNNPPVNPPTNPPADPECIDLSIISSNIDCFNIANEPVCGCDGVTYFNSCEAYWYTGVIAYTTGPCAGDTTPPVEPPTNPSDPPTNPSEVPEGCIDTNNIFAAADCSGEAYDPVCGCDGVTYDNICEAYFIYGLSNYTLGACAGTINPPTEPPTQVDCFNEATVIPGTDCSGDGFNPVCACDGVTYNNICEAYFLNGLDEYSIGPCEAGNIQAKNMDQENALPLVVCHPGFNAIGEEIISASASIPSSGSVRFFDNTCFQFIPSTDFHGTAYFNIKWHDQNGLVEKAGYSYKSGEEISLGTSELDEATTTLEVRYDKELVWFFNNDAQLETVSYEIYSLNGGQIFTGTANTANWSYDTTGLPKGIYIVKSNVGNERFLVR